MITNYKFINYKKLLKEIDRNDNIKIYLDKVKNKYIVPKNSNVNWSNEYKYFKNTKNIWIDIYHFKIQTISDDHRNIFVFLLENNLIYKCTDEQDDWSDEPEIQLYMHNKELFNKIYRKTNV